MLNNATTIMNDYFLTPEFEHLRVIVLLVILFTSALLAYRKSLFESFSSKIQFKITDNKGIPLCGVNIFLHEEVSNGKSDPILNSTTDKNGKATAMLLKDFQPEDFSVNKHECVHTYWVFLRKEGYTDDVHEITVTNNQTFQLVLSLIKEKAHEERAEIEKAKKVSRKVQYNLSLQSN